MHWCCASPRARRLKSCAAPASHGACSAQVTDGGQGVNALNELEWVDGEVWANIWLTNCIARIDPASGAVKYALRPLQPCAAWTSHSPNEPLLPRWADTMSTSEGESWALALTYCKALM